MEHLPASIWRLLKIASADAYRHNFFETAKGAAYSALLSFFPVIATLAALLVQARADQTAHTISSLLYEVAPPGTEDVIRNLFIVHGSRPAYLLVIAVALAAWGASGAIISLIGGFQAAYGIPDSRSFVRERLVAILLVFGAAIPLWAASSLIVFGAEARRILLTEFPALHAWTDWIVRAGQAFADTVAFCALVLAATLVYYVGPNREQSVSRVLPGAVLATLLWLVATLAVGWYLRHVTNYNVLYGSVGAGLALLVWMYVLAVIALFGCEFNAAMERHA